MVKRPIDAVGAGSNLTAPLVCGRALPYRRGGGNSSDGYGYMDNAVDL